MVGFKLLVGPGLYCVRVTFNLKGFRIDRSLQTEVGFWGKKFINLKFGVLKCSYPSPSHDRTRIP